MSVQKQFGGFLDSCRLCLRRPGAFNIFKIQGLYQDIFEFTSVKVFISDQLPQMLCHECSETINKIKKLREIAVTVDTHMRSFLNQTLESYRIDDQIEEQSQEIVEEHSNTNNTTSDEQIETYIIEEKMAINDDDIVYIPHSTDQTLDEHSSQVVNVPIGDEVLSFPKIIIRQDLFGASEEVLQCSTDTKPLGPAQKAKLRNIKSRVEQDFSIPHKCDVCSKEFKTSRKLYIHSRFHNKTIECIKEGCEKKFATKADLEKHVRTHTGEKPFECDECSRRFAQKVTLRQHIEAIHNSVEED